MRGKEKIDCSPCERGRAPTKGENDHNIVNEPCDSLCHVRAVAFTRVLR